MHHRKTLKQKHSKAFATQVDFEKLKKNKTPNKLNGRIVMGFGVFVQHMNFHIF